MTKQEAYGQAYQNGYAKGYEDGKKDAVEVVRCKDCKHMNDAKLCVAWEGFVREDDFCSYGERRTDD